MKKTFIFFSIVFLFIFQQSALAASSPTPSPIKTLTPTSELDKQINDLKDRIASKVASLNLVEKRGMIGTVTDVSETQITITNSNGEINFVDVDELTNFSSPSSKGSFGISDITKDSIVGVLGLYNKESRRTLARFVSVLNLPLIISGAVSDINKEDFSFTVTTPDNKEFTTEVENVTRTYAYTKDIGMIKSGFSKLSLGERVVVVGFTDPTNKATITALRVIRFSDLPINPRISISPIQKNTPTPLPTKKAQQKPTP